MDIEMGSKVPKKKWKGANCCVVGCHATQAKCRGLSFISIPKSGESEDQDKWRAALIQAINRYDKNFNPNKAKICSRHFMEGCVKYGPTGKCSGLVPWSLPTRWMPSHPHETPEYNLQCKSMVTELNQNKAQDSKLTMTWKEGYRIVDLYELARQMNCKICNSLLDLKQTQAEIRTGLASILYIACQCGVINHIRTSKRQQDDTGRATSYLINIKASICMRHCRLKTEKVCNFFTEMGIPATAETLNTAVQETAAISIAENIAQIETFSTYCGIQSHLRHESEAAPTKAQETLESHNVLHDETTLTPDVAGIKTETETDDETSIVESEENLDFQVHHETSEVKHSDLVDTSEAFTRTKSVPVMLIPVVTKRPLYVLNLQGPKEFNLCDVRKSRTGNDIFGCNENEKQKNEETSLSLEWEESSLPPMPASVMDTTHEDHSDTRSNTDSIASNHQHLVALLRTNHFRSRSQKGESKNYVINDVCAPFKCGECGARFALAKALNLHKKVHYSNLSPIIKCEGPDCSVKNNERQNKDIKKRDESTFQSANTNFQQRADLALEKSNNCDKTEFHFYPEFCETSKNKTNGSEVVNVYQYAQSQNEAAEDHVSTIPTLTKMFPCTECSLMVTTARSLRNHMKTHTGEKPFKCEACEKSFGERNALRKHFLRTHSENLPHVCQDCGKGFAFPSELNQHQVIHTGQKAHTCQECKASFTYAKNLHLHMRIHTGERSFSCEVCQKSFRQSSHLHRHLRAHSGERSFLCQDCGKTFTSKDNLDVHYRIHTGERPYRCPSCPATFRLSGSLNLHMNIHSGETFLCDICQKSFKSLQYFKEHKKVHDGEEFLCQECGKTFISKQQLRIHQRIHAMSLNNKDNKIKTKKSYSCKVCNATFTVASNVYRHKKIHMGIKPYSCKICHKQFRDSSCLKSHMRVHFKS